MEGWNELDGDLLTRRGIIWDRSVWVGLLLLFVDLGRECFPTFFFAPEFGPSFGACSKMTTTISLPRPIKLSCVGPMMKEINDITSELLLNRCTSFTIFS